MELVCKLRDTGLIKTGDFVLKSGIKSNLYFDFKGLNSHPKLIYEISTELVKLINNRNVSIAGVPLGAISYASFVAYEINAPMVLIREEKKNYGMCQQVEGNTFGRDMIVIEDVITTGQSVINTLKILAENNINVIEVICILDRQQGGVERINELGYKVTSLFTMKDILASKL